MMVSKFGISNSQVPFEKGAMLNFGKVYYKTLDFPNMFGDLVWGVPKTIEWCDCPDKFMCKG